MISANEEVSQFTTASNGFVRIRTIPDNVTQIPNYVIGGKRFYAGVKRLNVCMDITNNEDAHRWAETALYSLEATRPGTPTSPLRPAATDIGVRSSRGRN